MTVAAIEITPVCEEVMKLLPLLFFYLIFEPEPKEMPAAAIAIAVGFATFENVCYLTENGAANFNFLLIRGISAGALHLLCGVLSGFGAGGGGFLDGIPAVGGAIMIDGQLDRQILPDVIDTKAFEVIIARFLLNLFVFIVDDLVR